MYDLRKGVSVWCKYDVPAHTMIGIVCAEMRYIVK